MSLKAKIEAVLFLTAKPIRAQALARIVNADLQAVRQAVLELVHDYEERQGALEIADDQGYTFQVKDAYASLMDEFLPVEMSAALIRTLSAVAIKQPISQSEIIRIRGAGAYEHIRELVIKELIAKKEEQGERSPILSTTKKFQEYFRLTQEGKELRTYLKRQVKKADAASDAAANERQLVIPSMVAGSEAEIQLNNGIFLETADYSGGGAAGAELAEAETAGAETAGARNTGELNNSGLPIDNDRNTTGPEVLPHMLPEAPHEYSPVSGLSGLSASASASASASQAEAAISHGDAENTDLYSANIEQAAGQEVAPEAATTLSKLAATAKSSKEPLPSDADSLGVDHAQASTFGSGSDIPPPPSVDPATSGTADADQAAVSGKGAMQAFTAAKGPSISGGRKKRRQMPSLDRLAELVQKQKHLQMQLQLGIFDGNVESDESLDLPATFPTSDTEKTV